MGLLIFYLLCVVGWQCFRKLRIPSPTIIGPMVVICVANICGLSLSVPSWLQPLLSVATGTIIGLQFNIKLKGLGKPLLLAVCWMSGLSLLTARILVATGLTMSTALFAAMPGGIAEISLVSLTFGADIFAVALLQTSRLLLTMITFPAMAHRLPKNKITEITEQSSIKIPRYNWVIIPLLATSAMFLFGKLAIPASAILGPLLVVGLYTKKSGVIIRIDKRIQQYVQIGIGGLIGLGVKRESMLNIGAFILPVILLCIFIVGGSLLLAVVLHKISKWDMLTCLLSVSPAGITPTIMLAIELEADSSKVTVFQVLRMTTVLIFAPLSASFLLDG